MTLFTIKNYIFMTIFSAEAKKDRRNEPCRSAVKLFVFSISRCFGLDISPNGESDCCPLFKLKTGNK